MTIDELNDLRAEVQAEMNHHDELCMSTWSEERLLELIDAEIERHKNHESMQLGGEHDLTGILKVWIPMKERFPKASDANADGHIIAYSAGLRQSTVCLWYHVLGDNTTTHWMPLPEPPREVRDDN